MLLKLAFRNAKRSIKDYLIYSITITIAVSLIFAFNSIVFSDDISELSSILDNFKYVIIFISVVIIFIIGWLINYTISFLFHRRSKEFGTYMLLGIDNKHLARLFLLENIIIELIAFILGIIFGVYLYQIMTTIIMNIFETPYQITIHISLKAILLTLGYFCIISVYSLIRHRRKFKKMSIKKLIYADKENEIAFIKNKQINFFVFILSLCLMTYSIILFKQAMVGEPNFGEIFLSTILLIIGIYCFYLSISNFLTKLLKNKKIAYTKTNVFLIRTLSAKINSIGITFGTLAVLFTLTLISLNLSSTFKGIFETVSEVQAPTDFVIVSRFEDETFEDYREYINGNYTIIDEYQYALFYTTNSEVKDRLSNTTYNVVNERDYLLKLSNYNRLLEIVGEDKVSLNSNEFIISCPYNGLEKALFNDDRDINFRINGKTLQYQSTKQVKIPMRFSYYIIVVPDDLVEQHQIESKIYVVDTLEETKEEDFEKLSKYIVPIQGENGTEYIPLGNVSIKGQVEAQDRGLFTIISFTCYYLALIFICTALTIISIQQLSDSTKYRFRYKILDNMGLGRDKINVLVFKQLFYFYIIPTLLPIILSFIIVFEINKVFQLYLKSDYLGYLYYLEMIGVFFIIYIIYFIATLMGFIKNIK